MHQVHSREFKESAVEKFLHRGRRSVAEIAEEVGVSGATLYQWRRSFCYDSGMKSKNKSKSEKSERLEVRPQDRSGLEKLALVLEFESLSAEDRGEFLRREGLHTEHIVKWRRQMEASLSSDGLTGAGRSERTEERRRIKELEKELLRKDKALAEATALLVLKKKANLIWGTIEDE